MRKHETYPSHWFKNMKEIIVYDAGFKVPEKSEKYLNLTYGDNWRTPDKNWSAKKWMKVHKAKIRYKIRDKNIRDLWIKRGDI